MAFQILDAGGVLRTITGGKIRDGATLRTLRSIQIMDGATLRTVAIFANALTVAANDITALGISSTVSGTSTATPTGGLAPFTYAWSRLTGTATVTSGGTTASATISEAGLAIDENRLSTFRVTVTDSSGQTATDDIAVSLTRVSDSGGA